MNTDLKKIKKKYGEDMMHFCRSNFSSILEDDGLLFSLLESSFAFSHDLYHDIKDQNMENEFMQYILYLAKDEAEKELPTTDKTPEELFEELGYSFYECHTKEDIDQFKEYYKEEEQLCTFKDPDRLKHCHVFFAVKKNVQEIKRENFKEPKRQDEYGTSVLSIQFSKNADEGLNVLSIKNRYNHAVYNPDATFSNNLEHITPGLTDAFTKKYHLNIFQNSSNDIELINYTKAIDGKQYKYIYEEDGIYYGPNNIIIDHHKVKQQYLEKERYIVMEQFVVDLVNKEVKCYSDKKQDAFVDTLTNIEKIEIEKEKQNKVLHIKQIGYEEEVLIKLDKDNNIIGYKNNNATIIGKNFLINNIFLKEIILDQVKTIGKCFLYKNQAVKTVYLPNVLVIDSYFMSFNVDLENIYLPKVILIDTDFLPRNQGIKYLCFPKLVKARVLFFHTNENLQEIYCPFLKELPGLAFGDLKSLKVAYFPSMEETMRFKNFKRKVNPEAKIITRQTIQSTNTKLLKYLNNNTPSYKHLITDEMKEKEKAKQSIKCLKFL